MPTTSDAPKFADYLDPEGRSGILSNEGWKINEAQDTGNVPAFSEFDSKLPYLGMTVAGSDNPQIHLFPENIKKRNPTGDPARADDFGPLTEEATYEHEAHHAYDMKGGNWKNYIYKKGGNYEPQVIADIDGVRQYAASKGNRQLFDNANEVLWNLHNDPAHINHRLAVMHANPNLPDWYQAKYFGYRNESPLPEEATPDPGFSVPESSQLVDDYTQFLSTLNNAADNNNRPFPLSSLK